MRKEGGWVSIDRIFERVSRRETDRRAETLRWRSPNESFPSWEELARLMEEVPSKSSDSSE